MFVGGPSQQHRDDLIIITSSLGRVLRGGVNAQWVKAFLGDVEQTCPPGQQSVHGLGPMGEDKSIISHGLDEERS